MSWFQPQVSKYVIETTFSSFEDAENPFIQQVVEEEFVKVPLAKPKVILPTVEDPIHDCTHELTDVSE